MDRESLLINGGVALVFYVLGWFTCQYLSQHPDVINARSHGEVGSMQTPRKRLPRVRSIADRVRQLIPDKVGVTILVFVIAGLLIGIQQVQYQHAQDAYKERADTRDREVAGVVVCLNSWADNLVKTVRARANTNTAEKHAQERKDAALDEIMFTVVALIGDPPEADAEDFSKSLTTYVNAAKALERVREAGATTRRNNKYKKPDCDLPAGAVAIVPSPATQSPTPSPAVTTPTQAPTQGG